jgi:hypothetical protein
MKIKENGKYQPKTALEKFKRQGGRVSGQMLEIDNPGIGTLGVIDFLTKNCGYWWNNRWYK